MVCELRAGRNCVISDCEFCKKEVRKELTEVVTYHVPNVEIVWICFENNPEQCGKNVISSQREVKGRLPRIDTYTKVYSYPMGATTLPVGDGSIRHPPDDVEGLDL